jgi:diguanylate cyclase (GGDEF)-like protein/PAS domain S-box-containing protein
VSDHEQPSGGTVRDPLYWTLFQAAPAGVFRAAPDGQVLEANAEFRALVGADLRTEAALSLPGLCIRREDWRNVEAQLRAVGVVRSYHFEARRLDGAFFWAELAVSATTYQGEATLVGSLADISAWKAREEELRESALSDPLTGIANRTLFYDRVDHALLRSRRHPAERFAVLFLDIDAFKRINDDYSHRVGDELLVAISRRIQAAVRPEDTVARIGGDEFGILLENVHTGEEAAVVADRIRASVAQPFALGGHRFHITLSIGITLCDAGAGAAALVERADLAMYSVKRAGGGGHRLAPAPGAAGAAAEGPGDPDEPAGDEPAGDGLEAAGSGPEAEPAPGRRLLGADDGAAGDTVAYATRPPARIPAPGMGS